MICIMEIFILSYLKEKVTRQYCIFLVVCPNRACPNEGGRVLGWGRLTTPRGVDQPPTPIPPNHHTHTPAGHPSQSPNSIQPDHRQCTSHPSPVYHACIVSVSTGIDHILVLYWCPYISLYR